MNIARKLVGKTVRIAAGVLVPQRHFCCVCESKIAFFLPYTPTGLRPYRQPPFLAAMETVGSDIANFSCPRCGAHDRERHLFLYLAATGLTSSLPGRRILHLAPEEHLAALIARSTPALYVRGDLYPTGADVQKVDLQNIPFPEDSFDLVIANHVLEHVADDLAALAQIRRVLRDGGNAILQTPYSPLLMRTFEDAGIASSEARLQAYGQEDHVRLYGRDIFERFASAGFLNRTLTHSQALPNIHPRAYGVNPREPLFWFQKLGTDVAGAVA
jgi:SAM-dependent methyltransferase